MTTFPSIAPIHPANKRTAPLGGKLLLGDGYEVASRFGLNSVRPDWSLVWEVTEAEKEAIRSFLQARADAGEHFDWQPPDAATALRWRCDEWAVEQLAFNWFRVSATFRRVFELSPSILPAALGTGDFPGDTCLSVSEPSGAQLILPPDGPAWGQTLGVAALCTGQTVQWLRDGIPIAGATSATYTLGDDDMARNIAAQITCPGGGQVITGSVNGGTSQLNPSSYPSYTSVVYFVDQTTANINTVPCTQTISRTYVGGIASLSTLPMNNHAGRFSFEVVPLGAECGGPTGNICRFSSYVKRYLDGSIMSFQPVQSNCGPSLASVAKMWCKPYQ